MLELTIPSRGVCCFAHLALDLNRTLALDGRLIDGVAERLRTVRQQIQGHLLTADTFGAAVEIKSRLGSLAQRVRSGADKRSVVEPLRAESVVAAGNGAIDRMLSLNTLGIAILGPERLAREAVPGILPALDLLLHPQQIVATLCL